MFRNKLRQEPEEIFGRPERTERVTIELTIPISRLTDEQKAHIEAVIRAPLKKMTNEGDDVIWKQDLAIEYHHIVSDIEFVISLLDISSEWTVNTEELEHCRCIIQELFVKLEQLERKFSNVSKMRKGRR